MPDAVITKTMFFAAPRETVWAYLVDKEKLGEWFYPAKADLADGEDFALFSKDDDDTKLCWGTVQHMTPPSRLVYSFTIKPLGGVITTVTWTLAEVHGGTMLTMEHEGKIGRAHV